MKNRNVNGTRPTVQKDQRKTRNKTGSQGQISYTDHFIAEMASLGHETSDLLPSFVHHYVSGGRLGVGRVDPGNYLCSGAFARDYLLSELLTKFESFPGSGSEVRKQNALTRWNRAEMMCFSTNRCWSQHGHLGHVLSVGTSGDVLNRARDLISHVLGPLTPDTLERIFILSNHGPGGTTRVTSKNRGLCSKFSGLPEASPAISDWVTTLTSLYPEWLSGGVTSRSWSKMATVPKNAQTDRVICSEPDLNIFFQKGVGAYWKHRIKTCAFMHRSKKDLMPYGIKSYTIDLTDQHTNQLLAQYASIHGSLATVDLSMASDTVSYEVVRSLLPFEWFDLINRLRVGSVKHIDGQVTHVEKFSAMGNGFTFELESLIFWALARALADLGVSEHPVSVFGDDIIIDSRFLLNGDLELMLAICGFALNSKKSHGLGPFRESCGKHFFRGQDVTPFYVRKDITSYSDLLLLCNNIRRWSTAWGSSSKDDWLDPVYKQLVALLPPKLRNPAIPDGYGDGALIGTYDEIKPVSCQSLKPGQPYYRRYAGWEGHLCFTYVPIFERKRSDLVGVLLASLWGLLRRPSTVDTRDVDTSMYDPSEYGPVTLRGYKRIAIVCRQFPEL